MWRIWPEPVEGQKPFDPLAEARGNKSYHLNTIPNIHLVFESVGKTVLDSHQQFSPVDAAILPHHTDIGPRLDASWAEIAQHSKPEVIVLVSPAHWDQGTGVLQTTKGTWNTPFGSVRTDNELVDQIRKQADIAFEPTSFENEHGIGVHTPYIAHYFPNVPIVPIIAQSKAGSTLAREFSHVGARLEKKALFISSIDFSHYLPAPISARHDEETRRVISAGNVERIDQMGPEYMDSSFALQSYVFLQRLTGCRSQERWHGQHPGTTYFVYTCSTRSPLRISAVGDIMLARAVGSALEPRDQTTQMALQRTNDLLASVTAFSDLTFGNLESVLSTKGQALPKPYSFRANPAHVSLLQEWRISHLSVSNNHSEDYGKLAWDESVSVLQEQGLNPIGGYANEPVVNSTTAGGKHIAFLGFQTLNVPFSAQKIADAINSAKQTHDMVIVSMHWGEEYQPVPEQATVQLAHTLVDAGADVIFGHHPHVLQPVERYKDKLIFYSLGNFVFDQRGEEQNRSLIATVDVWDDGSLSYLLTPVVIEHYFPRLKSW